MYIESIIFDFYKNNNILKKYNPSTFNPFPLQDISCEKEFVAAQQFLKKLQESGILKRILLYDFEHYIVDAVLSSDNFEIYRKKYGQSLKISYIRRGLKRKPKVSVIVPVYNTEQYLKRCLDSICFQTLKDIEIICINDASTDDSLHILKEYALLDNRIKIVNLEQNQEVSHARNTGIEMARGEYIGFVDSDDEIVCDFYEKLYTAAKKVDADVSKGTLKTICGEYSGVQNSNDNIKKNKTYFVGEFCTAIYKRNFLLQYNLIFPEDLDVWEDCLFCIRVAKKIKTISFADDAVYYYFRRENSKSHTSNRKYINQWAKAANKILNEAESEDDYKILLYELILNTYFVLRKCIKNEEDRTYSDKLIQDVLNLYTKNKSEYDLAKLHKEWNKYKMRTMMGLIRKKRTENHAISEK